VPSIRVSVVIDAPRDVVWDHIEDIGSHVEWMADAVAIRFTSDRHSGVGTTFECDTKIGPFRLVDRMEVTGWRAGTFMAVRHQGLVCGDGRIVVRGARRGRTRVTWRERLNFPWWFGGPVGALVAKPVLRHIWKGSMRTLKARVEAGSTAPNR
jgi:hypothetical protein